MIKSFEFNRIGATTRFCGVLGHPIRHSASPAMHNPTMAAMGLDWNYLAFDVHPDDLSVVLTGARQMGFVGLNLTVPHKLLAHAMVDYLDESARKWGAVNTIRFEGHTGDELWKPVWQLERPEISAWRMAGFNTDADAVVRAINEELDLPVTGNSVLLLGAGGAGKVAALKLADAGVGRLHLVNRTQSKCEILAQDIHKLYPGVDVRTGYPDSGENLDLVINATSSGLKDSDPLPFDPAQLDLKNVAKAYDMIYQPAETKFLAAARNAGCRTSNGLGMLLYQGVAALEIWSGMAVPADLMRQALSNHVYHT